MYFTSTRIITTDVQRLVAFYEKIAGTPLTVYTKDFAELRTPLATLAIGSTNTLSLFGGEAVAAPGANRSVIIEFRVEDVDASYAQLAEYLGNAIVQPPTTMPWGNRSLLLRDPDGNLVNLFTPITDEAKQRAVK
ncbi:VOC family protein [Filimonas effusa]|uniref:VOC family protein n=1 Tax=Filimonas effusa TaxID=2508721 RepID=A0A4V1M9E4_9BACT|nr:VOC family protein [Filimonas effusa]RXK80812.1 VOC family protein [Filimonas effusa]